MLCAGGRAISAMSDDVATTLGRVRPDVVYHLAGYVSGSREIEAVLPSLRDNLVSAVNVLVAAARLGCSVVLAGSQEEPEPAAEDPVPASPYAAAKLAVGSFARMLHALHGLQVVNLRIFMVYGPGQHDRTKLVPYVITSLLQAERPRLSSGTRPVDWVYVDDVVDAFIAASSRDDLAGATLDVGTGELVTIRAIVERIVETVGTGVEPDFGALPRASTRDRPGRRRRTDEGPPRLAAPNDTHRRVALDSRLVPRRARARRAPCLEIH